jgi:hypothetical protein
MSDKIPLDTATAVVKDVNEQIKGQPAFKDWQVYAKLTPDGVDGFGVTHPSGKPVPTTLMSTVRDTLTAHGLSDSTNVVWSK